jgi:hypothetical protein
LTEAQKYKKALKTAEALASVASEGGMKTFDERMMQMKALLESWQTGKPFHMAGASQHCIPRNVSEKIDELFAENDEVLTDKESKTTSTSGKDKVAPIKNQRSSETQHCQQRDSRQALKSGKENIMPTTKNQDSGKAKVDNEQKREIGDKEHASEFVDIKMPRQMMKRGRPKGAGLTVIGLPTAKKRKTESNKLESFSKLKPEEKDRLLLECFVIPLVAKHALSGVNIKKDQIRVNPFNIPDLARDECVVDANRIEKYFSDEGWLVVLETLTKKIKIICPGCTKAIKTRQDSVVCERCLNWYHFPCVGLQTKPKRKNWFCKN